MKTQQKYPSIKALGASAALLFSVGSASASLIAYEDFDYATADGATLTAVGNNSNSGGTGWGSQWEQAGSIPGMSVSGSNSSLYFDQNPPRISDGSNHIFAIVNAANKRDFSAGVSSTTTYFTMLVRSFIDGTQSGGGAQLRVEFYDGLGATGNMRGNVGINGTSLFVSGNIGNTYTPATGDSQSGLFSDNTTYLLAMKRTGTTISASLIEANGDLSVLDSEPIWQVTHAQTTGVTFQSLRLVMNGSSTALRADELRVATSWSGAVDGLQASGPGNVELILESSSDLVDWTPIEIDASITSPSGSLIPFSQGEESTFFRLRIEPLAP